MNPYELHERIALVDGIFAITYDGAWALLGALAVLALCFSSLRALIVGDLRDPVAWFGRLLVVLAILSAYRELFGALVTASEGLAGFIAENAGWDAYWNDYLTARSLFEETYDSGWDRLLGWLQGGILTIVVSVTYYLEFLVFRLVVHLAVVFASLLYVLGPLLVAGGILGGGQTLRQWFSSLVQVLLWPAVPPFLMLMIVGYSGNALYSENLAFIIGQNITMCFLGLLTPVIVAFILGRGGVATFAAVVTGLASLGVTGVARSLASTLRSARGDAGGIDAQQALEQAVHPDPPMASRPGDNERSTDEGKPIVWQNASRSGAGHPRAPGTPSHPQPAASRPGRPAAVAARALTPSGR